MPCLCWSRFWLLHSPRRQALSTDRTGRQSRLSAGWQAPGSRLGWQVPQRRSHTAPLPFCCLTHIGAVSVACHDEGRYLYKRAPKEKGGKQTKKAVDATQSCYCPHSWTLPGDAMLCWGCMCLIPVLCCRHSAQTAAPTPAHRPLRLRLVAHSMMSGTDGIGAGFKGSVLDGIAGLYSAACGPCCRSAVS